MIIMIVMITAELHFYAVFHENSFRFVSQLQVVRGNSWRLRSL